MLAHAAIFEIPVPEPAIAALTPENPTSDTLTAAVAAWTDRARRRPVDVDVKIRRLRCPETTARPDRGTTQRGRQDCRGPTRCPHPLRTLGLMSGEGELLECSASVPAGDAEIVRDVGDRLAGAWTARSRSARWTVDQPVIGGASQRRHVVVGGPSPSCAGPAVRGDRVVSATPAHRPPRRRPWREAATLNNLGLVYDAVGGS